MNTFLKHLFFQMRGEKKRQKICRMPQSKLGVKGAIVLKDKRFYSNDSRHFFLDRIEWTNSVDFQMKSANKIRTKSRDDAFSKPKYSNAKDDKMF